jgi:integrase/recombinase XerD
MTQARPAPNQSERSNLEALREHTTIDHIMERLSSMDLPGKEHLERYLRHEWQVNHKPRTIRNSLTSIMLFLQFYGTSGKGDLTELERSDLEAFIERERDRGMYISTVRVRMASIIAFLHFLMEHDVLSPSLLKRKIRLKLPDTLPRGMNPKHVKKLIQVIDDTRDRALILLLLRTEMRIGEVLGPHHGQH